MFGHSHNSRGLSENVGDSTPRWRTVFIAVALALAIGSAGQTAPAQVAQAGATELSFYMSAKKEREGSACKGELVHVSVLVKRHNVPSWWSDDELVNLDDQVTGVEVNGLVLNPNIGQLSPNKNTTIWDGIIYPGSADFIFTAENYGETTISFRGQVVTPGWFGTNWGGGSVHVSDQVDVRVIPCKVKVRTDSTFSAQGVNVRASMEGEMKADEQGNFTGSGAVNWIGGATVARDCSGVIDVASSQADLTGNLNESDQLAGEVTYLPATLTHDFQCAATNNTIQAQVTPDPLVYNLPPSGGVSTQAQDLREPTYYSMHGSAGIVLIPEEDNAAAIAFNAANPEARVGPPSAWWTMLWGNFPWLYGALPVIALTGTLARRRKRLMKHSLSRQWRLVLLMLIPLLVSSACRSSGSSPGTPTPGEVTIQADVVFGPGAFMFPDTKAGLSDLAGYKASLTLSFDGTRDGKAQKWAKTYVMLTTKDPAARELTIENTGDLPDLNTVLMAEVDGATYERRGGNACNANVIKEGNSLGERLEPAGFLTGVIGAEEAGNETVNDVAANHYSFDERAFGQLGVAQSTGEMWVASNGGYIVKYVVTTKGNADYFGKGIEGTLTWDYELTDVNQPVNFKLPEDCPAGMVNAPLLPDAANVLKVPSVLAFDTSTGLADAAAFYQKQIPDLGWRPIGEPATTEKTVVIEFAKGDQKMSVIVTTGDTGTKVSLLLGRS